MLVTGIPFGTSSPLAEQVRGPGSWGRPALRCDHAAPADVRDYGGVGPTVDHSHDPAMKQPGQLTPHLALRRGSILGRTVLLCAGLAFLAACGEDRTGPETPSYRITDGPACGDVVFAESLVLVSTGAVLGLAVGGVMIAKFSTGLSLTAFEELMAEFSMPAVLYPSLTPEHVAITLAFTITTAFLSALWPAWIAGRLQPVEAMRHVA